MPSKKDQVIALRTDVRQEPMLVNASSDDQPTSQHLHWQLICQVYTFNDPSFSAVAGYEVQAREAAGKAKDLLKQSMEG